LRDEAIVDNSMNPKHWTFSAARNHDCINSYNPLLTMAWLANTDVSPVTSVESVLLYIGKYATKEEKKSSSYTDILKTILEQVGSLTLNSLFDILKLFV
jgi:hypothetical protein